MTDVSRPGQPPTHLEVEDSDLQEVKSLEKQLNGTVNFTANCIEKFLESMERMSDHYKTNQITKQGKYGLQN